MYNPKYPYKELTRNTGTDGKRLYATPDGKRVPSVTTILSATQPEEKKKILKEWQQRVGVERAQAITTDAANRGTKMHAYLENYVKGEPFPEPPKNIFHLPAHRMAKTIIDQGLVNVNEVWGTEVPVYFPGVYAGTTDLVGVHNNNEAIMDHKQSNRVKKAEWIDDYKIQLAAYAEAHNEVHGTKINKGVVFMAVKPQIDESTGNLLSDPIYQEFIIEGADFDYWRKEWWKRVEQYYLINS